MTFQMTLEKNTRNMLNVAKPLILVLCGLSFHIPVNAAGSEQLMQQTFLKFSPAEEISGNTQFSPVSLTSFVGEPFVVYFWTASCGDCIQSLNTLNTFAQDNTVKVITVRVDSIKGDASAISQSSKKSALEQNIGNHLRELQALTHLHSPYVSRENLGLDTFPTLQVFNKAGQTAAYYPDFKGQWSEVITLVNKLETDEFASYSMNKAPRIQKTPDTLVNFERIALSKPSNPQDLLLFTSENNRSSDPGSILQSTIETPPHDVELSPVSVALNTFLTNGRDSGPNWRGLNATWIHATGLDSRVHFNTAFANAGSYESQSIADDADDPEENRFSVDYESYLNTLRFQAGLFYQTHAYRDDTGFNFEGSHLFWNDRTYVQFGIEFFNASHDESTTVSESEDDQNRRHHVMLSHILNPTSRMTFSWYHNALQGIIENPDDLVEFQFFSTIGRQYALYPTTRTENNIVLQYITAKEDKELTYGYSFFDDTWGREKHTLFQRTRTQLAQWHLDATFSLAHQSDGVFYSDLFAQPDAQSLLTRHPHFSGYDALTLDVKGAYPLKQGWWDKETYITLGAGLGYFDFEDLTDSRENTGSFDREPLQEIILTTSIGIEMKL